MLNLTVDFLDVGVYEFFGLEEVFEEFTAQGYIVSSNLGGHFLFDVGEFSLSEFWVAMVVVDRESEFVADLG